MSQDSELGLSFCFMECRRRNFEKKEKKEKKSYPFFTIK